MWTVQVEIGTGFGSPTEVGYKENMVLSTNKNPKLDNSLLSLDALVTGFQDFNLVQSCL